jgi:2-(1,2-epoxy-1,2-dihydrophenyl)acetyl-CoA isomerase
VTDQPSVDQQADEEVLTSLEQGVLWITINRADRGNAIPYYVRDRLIALFTEAHHRLDVRCVVITSAGEKHFCTGADLAVPQPPRYPQPDGIPERPVGSGVDMMRAGMQRLMVAIQDCQKPVVAAVNGTAAGGGVMLALAADLVVAAEHARFIQVFVRRGLMPDAGVAYLLPRVVGMHRAKELVFFGDDLSAPDAERLGLVNKVVAGPDLRAAAAEWAERLAAGPTKAIGWSKKLLHDAWELDRDSFLWEEAMLVELNIRTEDLNEGRAAFMERRDPTWHGY